MKIIHWLFMLLFLIFAALQYNDPDPVIWIPIYGAMTVVCALAGSGRFYNKVNYILIGIYGVYSFLYLPGVIEWLGHPNKIELFSEIAKMDHSYIEESREFLGLMICVGVLLWYVRLGKAEQTA